MLFREKQELYNGGSITYSGPPLHKGTKYTWNAYRNGTLIAKGQFKTAENLPSERISEAIQQDPRQV